MQQPPYVPMMYAGPPQLSQLQPGCSSITSASASISRSESLSNVPFVPLTGMANDRSRNPSRACSRAGSVKDFSLDSSRFSDSPSSETKQGLILDVRKNLDNLLCSHFKHKFEGNVMIVYSDNFMHQLDEQRDVLRGNRVANIRAKSK